MYEVAITVPVAGSKLAVWVVSSPIIEEYQTEIASGKARCLFNSNTLGAFEKYKIPLKHPNYILVIRVRRIGYHPVERIYIHDPVVKNEVHIFQKTDGSFEHLCPPYQQPDDTPKPKDLNVNMIRDKGEWKCT